MKSAPKNPCSSPEKNVSGTISTCFALPRCLQIIIPGSNCGCHDVDMMLMSLLAVFVQSLLVKVYVVKDKKGVIILIPSHST